MSDVLHELAQSKDPVEQALARALRKYQLHRKSNGLLGGVGYEPRDIRNYGAVKVIERRVRTSASGFNIIPEQDSYETIVATYSDRFSADVVKIARERLKNEGGLLSPTADDLELDAKVQMLLNRGKVNYPNGIKLPQKAQTISNVFLRDPAVKAFVLQSAHGVCQSCGVEAPFKTAGGRDYLEVHHIKPLAEGGSDTVSNAVAICPNCHRAMHLAEDRQERTDRLFAKFNVLIRERSVVPQSADALYE